MSVEFEYEHLLPSQLRPCAFRRAVAAPPGWARLVPIYAIGSLVAFWCFERAAALVGG